MSEYTPSASQEAPIDLRFIILASLFSALVFVATYAVQIPLPGIATGGLMHLGNVALFTISILFGKKYGAVSGAFGMALFDILSPWIIWAPGTFIIRGIMGYAVGSIANSGKSDNRSILKLLTAMILPSIWMIVGYFGYNVLLYRDWRAAMASIPGDLVQVVVGIIISLTIIITLDKTGTSAKLKRMASTTSR